MTSQSSQTLNATVEAPDRLDRFLALAFPEVSRARFQRLIAEGHVSVEGVPATEIRHKLKAGQRVEAVIPPAVDPEPRAETIPLTVVYEDKDLIVIDKQPQQQWLTIDEAVARYSGDAVRLAGLFLGPPDAENCLLYTSPSPRDRTRSRMPSSA
mgnify:CR=1 FL=1